MWDDYGDGWNGCFMDVLVDGMLVLEGVTLESGSGPESVTFPAATGQMIETIWVPAGWPYECSYCIYDGTGIELGCDGLDGAEPTGIIVIGSCEGPVTGACCDPYVGICIDGLVMMDCPSPLQFFEGLECAQLDPPCGNPGACCDDGTGICTIEFEANCAGRFIPGAACEPDPFDPPCGSR